LLECTESPSGYLALSFWRSAVSLRISSMVWAGGRHLRYPEGMPIANLFVTMMDRLGVHRDQVGDSTGQIEPLSSL
jgi:hypothetical protein